MLVFRCAPITTPYLGDEDYNAGVLVEALVTLARYNGAEPITLPVGPVAAEALEVSISIDGSVLAEAVVRLNSTSELHFPLVNLSQPRKQPFSVDCTASYASHLTSEPQKFSATTTLSYLPRPASGSVTKRDSRTGALLVRPPGSSAYEAIFPIGFYTSFDNYLDDPDLGILDELKAQGCVLMAYNHFHPSNNLLGSLSCIRCPRLAT